ncbi:MAG: hypothetical protein MK132_02060 [Lentisphaerales bacterium]|nr:hypothetical protein [Lentisphaerales bacterium]
MDESTAQSQKGKSVFMTMVGLLGLQAEVKDKASGKNIILSVSTDEPGRLIGRNGSSLDSVGLLMNRILRKEDNTFPKVIIDVDGYDKKSKNDRRNKRKKNNPRHNNNVEKTVVMTEDVVEEEINLYVDEDSGKVDPVVTVAPGESDERSERPRIGRDSRRDNRRGRDNRRDNRRGRDNRRDNRERGPKQEEKPVEAAVATGTASQHESKPAPAKADSKPQAQEAASSAPKQESKSPAPKQEAISAPAAEKNSSKPKSSPNRLQMQCRNAAKEVKRWGEDVLLPPMPQSECEKAIQNFANDKEIKAEFDSRNYGDKKRVRLSAK